MSFTRLNAKNVCPDGLEETHPDRPTHGVHHGPLDEAHAEAGQQGTVALFARPLMDANVGCRPDLGKLMPSATRIDENLLGARDHRLHQLDRRERARLERRERLARAHIAEIEIH